jgi:hypothetical protein
MNPKVKKMRFLQLLAAMFVVVSFMLSQVVCAQSAQNAENQQTENYQSLPEFKGEGGNITEYLGYNLKYPEEAMKAGVNIRAYYKFFVEIDGTVTNIKLTSTHVEKDSNLPDVIAAKKACEEAALAIIESTSKQWKPAEKDGLPVRAEIRLPVWFKFH